MFSKKKKNKNELLLDLTADNFSAKKAREISTSSNNELSELWEKARNIIKEGALKGTRKCKICECRDVTNQDFSIVFDKEKLDCASCYLKYFLDKGFLIQEFVYVTKNDGTEVHLENLIDEKDFINLKKHINSVKFKIEISSLHIRENPEYRVEYFVIW